MGNSANDFGKKTKKTPRKAFDRLISVSSPPAQCLCSFKDTVHFRRFLHIVFLLCFSLRDGFVQRHINIDILPVAVHHEVQHIADR